MDSYKNPKEKEEIVNLPLYNKVTIFLIAALTNTFVGAIFYAMNLSRIGKKSQIPPVLIFGFFWNWLCLYMLPTLHITNMYLRIFLPNLLGGLILISFFWDYHFKGINNFKSRSSLIPILVVISLWALSFMLKSFLNKQF